MIQIINHQEFENIDVTIIKWTRYYEHYLTSDVDIYIKCVWNVYWVWVCAFASFSASKVWRSDRPRPGLMTRRNTGRSRGSCGRPAWCESWAGRDGANQEYLNDEIFSQPLFSPGQLSRAVRPLVSAAPRPMSSVLYYRCCLRMWPDVATGEQTITTTSRILSCYCDVGQLPFALVKMCQC